MKTDLPKVCFTKRDLTGELILIQCGVQGYHPTGIFAAPGHDLRKGIDAMNESIGVTKAQEQAMVFGSMFGFDTPGADPAHYDDAGNAIPPSK